MISIPKVILDWLRSVFLRCNTEASKKLSVVPNSHEEWLDLAIIEQLTQVSVPFRFPGDWVVRIDTHFLGATPMHRRWEVADLAILVMFRTAGKLIRTKVALLQSKRLYAREDEHPERDEERERRYYVGISTLYDTDEAFSLSVATRRFSFTRNSQYRQLSRSHRQFRVIDEYETEREVPVYYLLYNPFVIPHSVTVPLLEIPGLPDCKVGCRIVPARMMRSLLSRNDSPDTPSYGLLKHLPSPFTQSRHRGGWRLEHFVVDLLLQCKTGRITDVRDDEGLYWVFNEKSGPIGAAISITLDAPASFDWGIEPETTTL